MNALSGAATSSGHTRFTPDTSVHHAVRADILELCIILVLAAALRFYRLDVTDWSQDHSDIALLAQDVYYGNGVPLLGLASSAAIPNSPYFVYPFIIPIGLSTQPVFLAACASVGGLMTLVVLWLIGLRYWGSVAAATAALAYSVNPWVIGYNRSMWAGDHRATLIAAGILLGLLGFREGKRWAQLLCFPVFFVGVQVHYAAWTLLPLYPLLLLLWPKHISWKLVACSLALGLLTLIPFAMGLYQAAMAGGGALPAPTPQARGVSLREIIKPAGQMLWLATGTGTDQYTARANAAEFSGLSPLPQAFWWLLAPTVATGLLGVWRVSGRRMASLLAAWVALPLMAFALPILGVYPHYFIPVVPALALLIGVGFAYALDALTAKRRVLQAAFAGAFILIFASQAIFWPESVDYVDAHYASGQFATATPSHFLMDVVAVLRAPDARGEAPVARSLLFVTSDDWLERSRSSSRTFAPFLRDLAPTLRDLPVSANAAVASPRPQVIVAAPRVTPSAGLAQFCARGTATSVALRPGEGEYLIYHLPPYALSPNLAAAENSGSGPIHLVGAARSGGLLTLVWDPAGFGDRNVDCNVDLEDSAGALLKRVVIHLPPIQLAADEHLLTWIDSPPAAAVQIRAHVVAAGSAGSEDKPTEIDTATVHL